MTRRLLTLPILALALAACSPQSPATTATSPAGTTAALTTSAASATTAGSGTPSPLGVVSEAQLPTPAQAQLPPDSAWARWQTSLKPDVPGLGPCDLAFPTPPTVMASATGYGGAPDGPAHVQVRTTALPSPAEAAAVVVALAPRLEACPAASGPGVWVGLASAAADDVRVSRFATPNAQTQVAYVGVVRVQNRVALLSVVGRRGAFPDESLGTVVGALAAALRRP